MSTKPHSSIAAFGANDREATFGRAVFLNTNRSHAARQGETWPYFGCSADRAGAVVRPTQKSQTALNRCFGQLGCFEQLHQPGETVRRARQHGERSALFGREFRRSHATK